jgi:6-phosphogluconolactonase
MALEVLVADDPTALARSAAQRLAAALRRAQAQSGRATLALPAGSFVRPIYEELTLCSLDWSRVEFFFSEERGVPPGHPASAYSEAQAHLFQNPRIGAHQVHGVDAAAGDRRAAAERYELELPERFDAMLFEIGIDGHLGAIHAGSAAFDEDGRRVLALEVASRPHHRIALAPAVIREGACVVVVATGAERAPIVARVLEEEGEPRQLPARLVRERTWILDRRSASRLSRTTLTPA